MAPEVADRPMPVALPSPLKTTTCISSPAPIRFLARSLSRPSRTPCAPAGAEAMAVYSQDPENGVKG